MSQSKPFHINCEFHVLCLEYIILLWNRYILGIHLFAECFGFCEKGLLVPLAHYWTSGEQSPTTTDNVDEMFDMVA